MVRLELRISQNESYHPATCATTCPLQGNKMHNLLHHCNSQDRSEALIHDDLNLAFIYWLHHSLHLPLCLLIRKALW